MIRGSRKFMSMRDRIYYHEKTPVKWTPEEVTAFLKRVTESERAGGFTLNGDRDALAIFGKKKADLGCDYYEALKYDDGHFIIYATRSNGNSEALFI